jgi:hypothetical protein
VRGDLLRDGEGKALGKFIGYEQDFGFTNDPTALVEVYQYNGERRVNELVYDIGLTNSDIHEHLSIHVQSKN